MRSLLFITLLLGVPGCTQHVKFDNTLELPPKRISNEYMEPETTAPAWIWKFKSLKHEKLCLAKNIYFEARGESLKGQIAVGLITINRVKSKRFPQSICKNVYKKLFLTSIQKTVAQFSWTIDHISNQPKNKKVWNKIKRLAGAMLAEGELDNFVDITKGATHYHHKSINPRWSNLRMLAYVGNHKLYYDPTSRVVSSH